jgi:hypothetical protein
VVTPENPDDPLEPRAVVIGVSLGGVDKAYPLAAVVSGQCLQDTLGGVPIALVASDDGKSVRGFAREVEGQVLDLFAKPESTPRVLVDAETASTWEFSGVAVAGPLAGKRLRRIDILTDYWFDWRLYHSASLVHRP